MLRCGISRERPVLETERCTAISRRARRSLRPCCGTTFDALSARARRLQEETNAEEALLTWLREAVGSTKDYSGVIAAMVSAIADEQSALHGSCVTLRSAGNRLLVRAQTDGRARADMDGDDLFALISALAWLAEQPPLVPRSDRLFDIIADAILPGRGPR